VGGYGAVGIEMRSKIPISDPPRRGHSSLFECNLMRMEPSIIELPVSRPVGRMMMSQPALDCARTAKACCSLAAQLCAEQRKA